MSEAAVTETTETPAATESSSTETASTQTPEASSDGESGTISDAVEAAAKEVDIPDQETKNSAEGDSEKTADNADSTGADETEGQGAPAEYDTFETGEGFSWNKADEAGWGDLMQQLGATQGTAQALLGVMEAHTSNRVIPDLLESQKAEEAVQRKAWLSEAKEDPVLIGEDGKQFDANINLAGRALKQFSGKGDAGEAVMAAVKEMGFLDHPATLKILANAGRSTMSDTLDDSGDPGSENYDNLPPEEKMGWDDNAEPVRRKG